MMPYPLQWFWIVALVVWLLACQPATEIETGPNTVVTRVSEVLADESVAGYQRAEHPRDFQFPADHGPHVGFRNEWWYITGHLEDDAQQRWGLHLTLFRVALAPEFAGEASLRDSAWSTRHLWMGHAAITDLATGRHVSTERFAREAVGLAGALANGERIWLEDWFLADLDQETWRLRFAVDAYTLDLALTPLRAPVLQGEAGLSQKGHEPGNASYYYSIPRIAVHGQLDDGQTTHPVHGQAWLDREWGTSALGTDQIGWNWFALQLDAGLDVMVYQLRQSDGQPHPLSKGRWMPEQTQGMPIPSEQFTLIPLREARMASGRVYPVAWRLQIPGHDVEWTIEALLDQQEMNSFIPYWEGAVAVRDAHGQQIGWGFVELTGYE